MRNRLRRHAQRDPVNVAHLSGDHAGQAAAGLELEHVVVTRGTGEILDAGEGHEGGGRRSPGAGTRAGDRPVARSRRVRCHETHDAVAACAAIDRDRDAADGGRCHVEPVAAASREDCQARQSGRAQRSLTADLDDCAEESRDVVGRGVDDHPREVRERLGELGRRRPARAVGGDQAHRGVPGGGLDHHAVDAQRRRERVGRIRPQAGAVVGGKHQPHLERLHPPQPGCSRGPRSTARRLQIAGSRGRCAARSPRCPSRAGSRAPHRPEPALGQFVHPPHLEIDAAIGGGQDQMSMGLAAVHGFPPRRPHRSRPSRMAGNTDLSGTARANPRRIPQKFGAR